MSRERANLFTLWAPKQISDPLATVLNVAILFIKSYNVAISMAYVCTPFSRTTSSFIDLESEPIQAFHT